MNTIEKAKYVQNLNDYMEKKRVYPVLEDLYKQLLLDKPENPIQYLIKHLQEGGSKLSRETYFYYWSTRLKDKAIKLTVK